MKPLLLLSVFLLLFISVTKAQNFTFRMGLGLGIDLDLRIDKDLPEDHTIDYKNAATATLDIFTKFTYKRFNFTPDFKISYATFGKGKKKSVNEAGTSMPEGEYLSFIHDGNFYETLTRSPYLLNKSDVTLSNMNVGFFATYNFLLSNLGWFEAGTGIFYFRKKLNIKDYNAHDVYDYYGSSGSHLTQTQTDEYVFTETVRDADPIKTYQVLTHMPAIPLMIQYNFIVGKYVELSPSFSAFFSQDIYYNINFSISFGNTKN